MMFGCPFYDPLSLSMIFQSNKIQKGFLILFQICIFFSSSTLFAKAKEFVIANVSLKNTEVGAYLSYQHRLLLISIVQKSGKRFDCLPNRYILYSFKKDEYREVLAGNFIIDSKYKKAFFTKIQTIPAFHPSIKKEWVYQTRRVMRELGVSSITLEKSKLVGKSTGMSCWQQAATLDLKRMRVRKYPVLVASLCKNVWCSAVFWKNRRDLQLWGQMSPSLHHLITLNTGSSTYRVSQKRKKIFRSFSSQMNAPRQNLFHKKATKKGSVHLTGKKGRKIWLIWKTLPNSKFKVSLFRERANQKKSRFYQRQADRLLKQKKTTESLKRLKFAMWLAGKKDTRKYAQLKIFLTLRQFDALFASLKKDFSDNERHKFCQKLHGSPHLRNQWKQQQFVEKFRKACF